MTEHHDAVVVGSGFGGAAVALRLAEAGRSVSLLERGRAYPPGSFARSPDEMRANFWDPSEGQLGLFDIWSFRGIDAVFASGLGGGSLIYANVLLRKDEHWFVEEDRVGGDGNPWTWPVGRADLDPFYDLAEQELGATPFPLAEPGYDSTAKTLAMRRAAERLGLEWQLPPLAVSFASEPGADPVPRAPLPEPAFGNLHGLPRSTCRLCGECDLGCNDGAKNTLDHTYLSRAKHHGAQIRELCEVRRFAPRRGGGWDVWFVQHDPAGAGTPTPTRSLPETHATCDRLVLAAGTLGTNFLLLANRSALPGVSPMLGHRFSGNGDILGFMTRARNADGGKRVLDGADGPVITSAIRLGDEADRRAGADPGASGRGAYIEDAGYPEFANWLVETIVAPTQVGRSAKFLWRRVIQHFRPGTADLGGELAELLQGVDVSATSLPLLGMGRDTPDGVLRLKGGRLDVDWSMDTSAEFFDRVTETMRAIADANGAEFAENVLSHLGRVVTVHPLGGAPMGRTPDEGVVDDRGRVFGHDGLYVVDGAVMPGPVGANPSLTIAAFAERAGRLILEEDQ